MAIRTRSTIGMHSVSAVSQSLSLPCPRCVWPAIILIFALGHMCAAQSQDGPATATEAPGRFLVGPDEGWAIIHAIREKASPGIMPPAPQEPPKLLDTKLQLPLVASLYREGRLVWHGAAADPTLRLSAENLGERMKAFFNVVPEGYQALADSVVVVDVVIRTEPALDARSFMLDKYLIPGIDGLSYATQHKAIYLTPLDLFRHWHEPDIIETAFKDVKSETPPADFTAERFQSMTFLESRLAGRALQLYRGNVLVPQPDADEILQALFRGGLQLAHSQRNDGSFPGPYHPDSTVPITVGNSLVDQLRAALMLDRLNQLVGDKEAKSAAERAYDYVAILIRDNFRREYLYVPARGDEVAATALALNVLCVRELQKKAPTADGAMRFLANFLVYMTDRDGRIYSRIPGDDRHKPPYETRGGSYAEALIALSLIERISPSRPVKRCADRIASLLISDRAVAPYIVPRTVEALGYYYRIAPRGEIADAAIRLASKMVQRQVLRTQFSDYIGGWSLPDLAPDTLQSADTLAAVCMAYQLARQRGSHTETLAGTVHRGCGFLLNMQYRSENSFFLARSTQIEGAFRTGPEDLRIRLAHHVAAANALMPAAVITAKTMPPKPIPETQRKAAKQVDKHPRAEYPVQ